MTRVINTLITAVSLILCLAFLFALIGFGVEPSAQRPSTRREVLSILPTGKAQNSVPRAFDQVTGVLEGVSGFDVDYRVEFVPLRILNDPSYSPKNFVRPETILIVAPGTSKGTNLVVPARTQSLPSPVLLTTVTGTETVERLAALGATITSPKNSEMAGPLADSIAAATNQRCADADIRRDKTDLAYSVSLADALQSELRRACSEKTTKKTYVLVGNEEWWDSGERPQLTDAAFVFLSDGLTSARVIRGVQRAATDAQIFAATVRIDNPGNCIDRKHRKLEGRNAVPYMLHIINREATCLFLDNLLNQRRPNFVAKPGFEKLTSGREDARGN